MAAPKTVYTYDLNGSERDFQIPFEYLARKFVVITLVGQDRKVLTLNIDYRFTQRTIITTTVAWGPSDGYERIEIRRYTSATERLVDFSDGSILRAYDLNTSQVQSLHIAEEGRDVATDTIGTDNDGNLDARGRKIVNLADAVQPGDAVTLRQEQEWAASTLGNKNASEASAIRSKASEDAARASQGQASQAAVNSKASEDSARASAKIATDEIAKIDGQVDAAKGHADRSKAEADKSAVSATEAGRQAGLAGNSASAAKSSQDAAKVSETNVALAQVPLFTVLWWGGKRTSIPAGYVPGDGQLIPVNSVTGIRDGLSAFGAVAETEWQAAPAKRSYWAFQADGVNYRVPDLNGKSLEAFGATFLRGDGKNTTGAPGIMQDRLQDHAHNVPIHCSDTATRGQLHSAFAFDPLAVDPAGGNILTGSTWLGTTTNNRRVAGTGKIIPAVGVDSVRVGVETSPVAAIGCWIIKVFGAVLPAGMAEIQQFMNTLAAQNLRITELERVLAGLRQAPSFREEILYQGGAGSDVTVALSRPPTPGETWKITHTDGNSTLANCEIPMNVVGGGAYISCAFLGTGATQMVAYAGGVPTALRIYGYTSGYGVRKIAVHHRIIP